MRSTEQAACTGREKKSSLTFFDFREGRKSEETKNQEKWNGTKEKSIYFSFSFKISLFLKCITFSVSFLLCL